MMTTLVVRSGGAVEANPLVRFGGLPAKVILVGVLTVLLYRRRPVSLVWPAAALLWRPLPRLRHLRERQVALLRAAFMLRAG